MDRPPASEHEEEEDKESTHASIATARGGDGDAAAKAERRTGTSGSEEAPEVDPRPALSPSQTQTNAGGKMDPHRSINSMDPPSELGDEPPRATTSSNRDSGDAASRAQQQQRQHPQSGGSVSGGSGGGGELDRTPPSHRKAAKGGVHANERGGQQSKNPLLQKGLPFEADNSTSRRGAESTSLPFVATETSVKSDSSDTSDESTSNNIKPDQLPVFKNQVRPASPPAATRTNTGNNVKPDQLPVFKDQVRPASPPAATRTNTSNNVTPDQLPVFKDQVRPASPPAATCTRIHSDNPIMLVPDFKDQVRPARRNYDGTIVMARSVHMVGVQDDVEVPPAQRSAVRHAANRNQTYYGGASRNSRAETRNTTSRPLDRTHPAPNSPTSLFSAVNNSNNNNTVISASVANRSLLQRLAERRKIKRDLVVIAFAFTVALVTAVAVILSRHEGGSSAVGTATTSPTKEFPTVAPTSVTTNTNSNVVPTIIAPTSSTDAPMTAAPSPITSGTVWKKEPTIFPLAKLTTPAVVPSIIAPTSSTDAPMTAAPSPITSGTVQTEQRTSFPLARFVTKLTTSGGTTGNQFGRNVAINGDTIVVGAYLDGTDNGTSSGSAYVFTFTGSGWTEQAKLTASDGAPGDLFGNSVAINRETIVIGAYFGGIENSTKSGSAYVYAHSGTVWTEQAKLTADDSGSYDYFGISVAIDENIVVVGAFHDDTENGEDSGSAYVYSRFGTVWTEQAKLMASDGTAEDLFGHSLAIHGDTIVIGAYRDDTENGLNSGSAYVYTQSGTFWTEEAKLTASDGDKSDRFGRSLAIDENTIVIGAYQDDAENGINSGSAYVYIFTGTVWTQQAKFMASDGAAYDLFGWTVSVYENIIAVGAYLDDTNIGIDTGSAYVYTRSGTDWTEEAKLTASDGTAYDQFGFSLAVDGDTIVVGAANGNDGCCSVHVFNVSEIY